MKGRVGWSLWWQRFAWSWAAIVFFSFFLSASIKEELRTAQQLQLQTKSMAEQVDRVSGRLETLTQEVKLVRELTLEHRHRITQAIENALLARGATNRAVYDLLKARRE